MSEGLRDRLATIIAENSGTFDRWSHYTETTRGILIENWLPAADALIGAGVVLPTDPPGASDVIFGKIGADGWKLYVEVVERLHESGWLTTECRDEGEPEYVFDALNRALAARVPDPTPPAASVMLSTVCAVCGGSSSGLLTEEERGTVKNWVRGIEQNNWNPTPSTKRLLASVLRVALEADRVVTPPTGPAGLREAVKAAFTDFYGEAMGGGDVIELTDEIVRRVAVVLGPTK